MDKFAIINNESNIHIYKCLTSFSVCKEYNRIASICGTMQIEWLNILASAYETFTKMIKN